MCLIERWACTGTHVHTGTHRHSTRNTHIHTQHTHTHGTHSTQHTDTHIAHPHTAHIHRHTWHTQTQGTHNYTNIQRCARTHVHMHRAHGGTHVWPYSCGVHSGTHTCLHEHMHTCTLSPGAWGQQGERPPRGRVPFAHLIQKLSAREAWPRTKCQCVLRGAACPFPGGR